MRDLYGDDYDSVAGQNSGLIPEPVRKLAGAAVFLGLILAMGLWSYRLGTRDAAEVPVIRAMEGPARVQPADPGGLQAEHQGLEVNSVLAGEPAPQPRASSLAAPASVGLAEEDAPQGELELAAAAPLIEVAVEGTDDLRMPVEEMGLEVVAVAPAPELGSVDPLAAQIEIAVLSEAAEAAGTVPAATLPEPRPKGRPANLHAQRVAAAKPADATPAPAAASTEAPAATTREAGVPKPGSRLVQLGAFDSEALTRQAWDNLVAGNGDLLGGRSLYVERTTSNARIFYRLRVAGFETTEDTRAMCEALRARGVDCIPVTLQ